MTTFLQDLRYRVHSVTRKTREIGIRMALGAGATDVLGMVIRQGVWLTLLGVAIGLPTAPAVTRPSMIFGVTPNAPLTFVAVAVILVIVALAGCYISAHRAMCVDPLVALRHD